MLNKKKHQPDENEQTPVAEQAAEEVLEGEAVELEEECDTPGEPEVNPLEEELAKQKELYLRLAAEYENFRKRTQREKEAINFEASAACVAELLPVIDNLERALAVENATAESMKQGVEMVLGQAGQIFEKLGVRAFGLCGDMFDANYHNCIGMVQSEEFPSGAVTLVVQKGYMFGDRVIRPAMVQVAQ